jgi:hypothetical protein
LGPDVDFDSPATFQSNFPSARFIRDDIRDVKSSDVEAFINPGRKSLFCGRVPRRPFSPTNRLFPKNDKRISLSDGFCRFVVNAMKKGCHLVAFFLMGGILLP